MLKIIGILLITLTTICQASELTFGYKNPSFSGVGWSTHALSIAQIEFNRAEGVKDDATAAEKAALGAFSKNSTQYQGAYFSTGMDNPYTMDDGKGGTEDFSWLL